MKRGCIYTVLLALLPLLLEAQIYVDRAVGCWELSRDITPVQAEQRALLEAKKEAMRKAGIPEEVMSASLLVQRADSIYFDEFYSQINVLQINAHVKVMHQEITDRYDPSSKRMLKEAVISAEVIRQVGYDNSFSFVLTGLNSTYRSGESLHFSLTARQDCFYHLFIFDPTGGDLIFPGVYEASECFREQIPYPFPRNRWIVYDIEKSDSAVRYEQNVLLVVATKADIPFTGKVTVGHVFDWLFRIPANQRCEQYYSFITE